MQNVKSVDTAMVHVASFLRSVTRCHKVIRAFRRAFPGGGAARALMRMNAISSSRSCPGSEITTSCVASRVPSSSSRSYLARRRPDATGLRRCCPHVPQVPDLDCGMNRYNFYVGSWRVVLLRNPHVNFTGILPMRFRAYRIPRRSLSGAPLLPTRSRTTKKAFFKHLPKPVIPIAADLKSGSERWLKDFRGGMT